MKNFYLALFGLLSIGAFAQNSNPWPTTGNVGIGTNAPLEQLEVLVPSNTSFTDVSFFGFRNLSQFPMPRFYIIRGLFIQNKTTASRLQYTSTNLTDGTLINNSFIDLNSSGSLSFGNQNTEYMRVAADGKVRVADGSINLPTPSGYRLFVQEGILTEKVKVAVRTTSNWADYVFAEDYELMPLEEVEQFTKENKHLPNVPCAEEMVTEGLDVAKMDAKLLEKIEELTLYLIEQNKKLEEQSKKLEEQNKKIETLQTELLLLKEQQD